MRDRFEVEVWQAFLALSEARDILKSGIKKISFKEIESWMNINGILGVERRQEIAHFVRFLDNVYFEGLKNAIPKSGDKQSRGKSRSG